MQTLPLADLLTCNVWRPERKLRKKTMAVQTPGGEKHAKGLTITP